MMLFATYCSRDKDSRPGDLPAIDRYKSNRIQKIFKAAEAIGAEFRILSGKYGLLEDSEVIPFYDHLLDEEEIPNITKIIVKQLSQINPSHIVFFSRSVQIDPCVAPYQSAMEKACQEMGIKFTIMEIDS
jgi:hypothetical protein